MPGCVAASVTLKKTEELIREAIEFHLEGMPEDGDATPAPTTFAEMIEVTAAQDRQLDKIAVQNRFRIEGQRRSVSW